MTSREFRYLALSLPEVTEQSHFSHPDFRVRGRIFASLNYPRKGWGMVKLNPKEQRQFVADDPKTFVPAPGKWGVRGATTVHLPHLTKAAARKALASAWRNTAPSRLTDRLAVQ